jgi:outer membrane receptor protein involved in Fe transport
MKIKFLKYFVFIFILLSGLTVFSQITIKGKVTDAANGKALQGATIIIKKLNLIATSDNNGNYIFSDVKAGTFIIKISFVGYRDTAQSITIVSGTYQKDFKLYPGSVAMDSVVVTATLTEKNIKDLPASVGIVTHEQIQDFPAMSADEYLDLVSGIDITRHYGIFYKTGDVTMRGLNRNVYTLLLIDGIPASVMDGGATNWNRINTDNIQKIEVIKGPNSSIYGSNAMGGVINIITQHPSEPFKAEANAFYGTYNTYGGNLNLSGSNIKNNKGFYWMADGYIRRSDGYVLYPDSTADSTDVRTYLKEKDASLRTGYSFNKNNNLEIEYDISSEILGGGKKYFEELGSYDYSYYQIWQARYHGLVGKVRINASAFYKNEYDDSQKESIKQSGAYTLLNTHTNSDDKGIWCNGSVPFRKNQLITFGFDSKLGEAKASDIYRTSTDTVTYKGNLDYYGLFVQDDFVIIKNKLKSIVGLRYDLVNFYNADFYIDAPSATTSFILPYIKPLISKTWTALSPNVGLIYKITENKSVYLNLSRGFRSASLNDLCQTADVNKGFKIANPDLKPEYLSNAEIGTLLQIGKFEIEPTLFYSIGKDFQYFVGTGDSIYTNKTKEQPVIKRENIDKVEIYGAELAMNYTFNKHFSMFANYYYNHSQIKNFDTTKFVSKDLTNKFLVNVPMHHLYSGVLYKSKIANISLIYKYTSSMWDDDLNTVLVKGYSRFDAKISKMLLNKFFASITVENIFNTVYLDSKGLLPPGRFFMTECKYSF